MCRRFGHGMVALVACSMLGHGQALAQETPPTNPPTATSSPVGAHDAAPDAPPTNGEGLAPDGTSPSAPPSSGLRVGPPSAAKALDLCALRSRAPEGTYQVQHVVFMNPLINANVIAPEPENDAKGNPVGSHTTLATINAGELARLLFAAKFPMQRLLTVYSPALATGALFDKPGLSGAELAEVTGGDDFVAYSAACADWILVPKLGRTSAAWQKVKRKKTIVVGTTTKEVEYLAWDFNVHFELEVALFKRGAQGAFTKYKVVTSAGAEGIFAGGGVGEPQSVPFHEYASTWPDASCTIGQPRDGQPGGIASCLSLEPKLSADLEPTAASSLCVDVDDAVGSSMTKIAGCGVAKEMERAVRVLQLHAKQDPWGMYTKLGPDLGISLGQREGAKRGDYYVAASPTGQGSSGFARIVSLGPGGEDGARQPSRVKFKTGDGEVGSRMSEFPLIGVHVGAHPALIYVLANGDLDTNFGYGAMLSLSYDASSYIPLLDEFWARADLGYLSGASNEGFVPLNLGVQAGDYVSSGLTLNVGFGLSALVASKQWSNALGQEESLSGTSGGLYARGGLSHAFSPDWDVALAVEARTGFSNTTLKNDKYPGVAVNAGLMTGALALLSAGHTF
jgi:hypothetical protein